MASPIRPPAACLAVNQVTSITASKAFAPAAVVQGGTSVLTVTINNAAAVAASLTAVFTDSLASMGAGYTIAAAPAGATTCGGALTAVPGATSFSLPIGTTIPAAGSCTITIPVRVAANAVTGGRVNTIAQTVLQTTQGRTQFPITATLTTSAALVVAKAFAPATVAALGTSRLTVTLTHANGAPAFSGLAFTDNLPAGHTIAAVPNAVTTCGGVVTAVSGAGVFSLAGGSLAAGATSCTVAVNVTTPAGAGAATNTIPATTGATTTEGFVNAAAATATITRVVTNVTLNKSFSPATVLVGGVSRMTINVLNTGANALALTATSLTDLLPVGMVIAPVPPNPAPTNTCGGVLTATPGTSTISIANGSIAANATCAIAVSVVANASGNLINTLPAGVFTSAQSVSNPLPALATLAATGSADLQVTKTDGVVNVAPGTTTTYTIVARNNGPQPVAGAGFTDTPPAGMAFTGWTCVASAGSACGNANGSGPINELVTLLLNGTVTYTVTAAIAPNAAGSITNTATIVVPGTVIDTNLANNTASDTDTLTPQADLAITKTDGVVSVVAGASTVYTIVVSNNGPSNVVGASVTDVMPAAIAGDTYTAVATGGATGFTAVGGGNINDTVNMPAGSTITYTVIANVNSGAGGNLVNTANVTAPGGVTDTNPGNNSATDSDVLTRQADLAITKTDGVVSACRAARPPTRSWSPTTGRATCLARRSPTSFPPPSRAPRSPPSARARPGSPPTAAATSTTSSTCLPAARSPTQSSPTSGNRDGNAGQHRHGDAAGRRDRPDAGQQFRNRHRCADGAGHARRGQDRRQRELHAGRDRGLCGHRHQLRRQRRPGRHSDRSAAARTDAHRERFLHGERQRNLRSRHRQHRRHQLQHDQRHGRRRPGQFAGVHRAGRLCSGHDVQSAAEHRDGDRHRDGRHGVGHGLRRTGAAGQRSRSPRPTAARPTRRAAPRRTR